MANTLTSSAELAPLATVADLVAFWRPLNGNEETRAEQLITMASNYLRKIAKNNGLDINEQIIVDGSGLFTANIETVVLAAVKRAMLTPQDAPPADSWSQAANPYSETIRFTNPSSDLFFKKSELELLGFSSIGGTLQIGVLRGLK
jgi:hypothetical protein